MNVWSSWNGSHFKRTPLETLLKPISFPVFYSRKGETRTQRAQRWRSEYKELTAKQHNAVLALVAHALAEAKGVPSLTAALQAETDKLLTGLYVLDFKFWVADSPLEVTVHYRLLGSAKTNALTVSLRSPSQQE
jgi:hypothetical protein